jgi:hypothetical protein
MKRALLALSLALATSLSLSACAAAQNTGAPSLAKRSVEGRFDVAPPAVVVTPPGPLPADLGGRLARWESDAAGAQQAFAAERNAAASLVAAAAGAPVASERWVVAQQAISRLVATRAPLTAALADIDRLYLDRSVEEAIDGLPEIFALRDRLADMVSTQDAVLEAMNGQLPGQ